MKVQLVGIDLLTVEARVLVASIETYVQQADSVSQVGPFAAGQLGPIDPSSGMLRNLDGHVQRNIGGEHLKLSPKISPKISQKMSKISSKVSPKTRHAPRRHRH
jgi:hypothetical protein